MSFHSQFPQKALRARSAHAGSKPPLDVKKPPLQKEALPGLLFGADDGIRTRDPHLGNK